MVFESCKKNILKIYNSNIAYPQKRYLSFNVCIRACLLIPKQNS
jgi:hypothetical protein